MRTVRHFVDLRADTDPERVYLVAPEPALELTYGRLRQDSRDLARYLLGLGLSKGDKVSLMLHNGYQTARLFVGVMYGGFVVAPINLLVQASQLAYVLEHSDTRAVFVAPDQLDRLNAALPGIKREIKLIVTDVDAPTIIDAAAYPDSQPLEVGEEDDALLMYTSGTTGNPKGCLLRQRNVIAGGQFVTQAHALTESDRVLAILPLYHINGQIVTAISPLIHGGSLVLPHRFSASNFWGWVSRYRCTWINVVPTIISYLLNGPDPRAPGANLELSQVRFGRSASAPLPPAQHRAFEEKFGIGVIETFGMTETAAPCFASPLDPAQRKYGSPGQAFGNEAKVVDASGNTLPPYQAGELMVRGDNVMKCYYKQADITAKELEPDGWLHTGDLGYVDRDGFYFITGRLKELIIKGGENIAPREIDEVLLEHPAVLEAAAVGVSDEHYGQEIFACVVLKPGMHVCIRELRDFCVRQLGPYKCPKFIRIVGALPKGPSGKVQRLKLAESWSRAPPRGSTPRDRTR